MLDWIAEHKFIALAIIVLIALAVTFYLRQKDTYYPVDLWQNEDSYDSDSEDDEDDSEDEEDSEDE